MLVAGRLESRKRERKKEVCWSLNQSHDALSAAPIGQRPRHAAQGVSHRRIESQRTRVTLLATRRFGSTSSTAAFAPATQGAFAPRGQELIVDVHSAWLK